MEGLKEVFLASIAYLSVGDTKKVAQALEAAERLHAGQKRESGELFFTHPLRVAQYLTQLEAERNTLIAALLHDAVEDNRVSLVEVKSDFGEEVAKLVDGLTKFEKLHYEGDPTLRQVASIRKMLLVASHDIRVLVIKIADRLHNIETIDSLRDDKKVRITRETLQIYVPFARILGLWDWKRRLETICFPLAYREECMAWKVAIEEVRNRLNDERMKFVKNIDTATGKKVHPKLIKMTDYELFQRLYGDLKRLEKTSQIDSVAIVITGHSMASECYEVLGKVHTLFPVHSLSFRDFINAPQPSGYQGLHTTIFLSRNHELRLRIQTEEMYNFATHRKFSSWVGKQGSDIYTALSSLNKVDFDRDRYLTDLKSTVLERINVFTTAGEILTLPRGATGVDFAFLLNPDYLFSLSGIRVNGELHESTYELHDGDTAELVLLDSGRTSLDRQVMWVEKVKTTEARDDLKQKLKEQSPEQIQSVGKTLLEYEVRKWKLPLWWLFNLGRTQQRVTDFLGEKSFESVLEKVGTGQLAVNRVIEAYKSVLELPTPMQRILTFFHLLPKVRVLNKLAKVIDIDICSVDRPGMIYNISKCFAEREINISKFSVYALPPNDALYQIRLEANDFDQFSNLYDALLQVPHVKMINRRN